MAFVPLEDIPVAYNTLMNSEFYDINKELLDPLLDYYEGTWMGEVNRRGVRRLHRFDYLLWNHYDSVKNFEPRTNNACEGWHNAFSVRAQASHVSIWKLINLLKAEQGTTELKIHQQEAGRECHKKKRNYVDYEARLERVVMKYDKELVVEFLEHVAQNVWF
ncbi:uncharacterized protein LOC118755022 [Rhagoletis pomonella]|uniref:uncharacterized protein LOC118755022 n=1 Tax=Rhagoletis pomonella TaxID=28610 RepID=UPI00177F1C3A|nr:uncharacterized protein LOC118755022 [Rhagoletis pomonella]